MLLRLRQTAAIGSTQPCSAVVAAAAAASTRHVTRHLTAPTVIVTASTNVLASDRLRFSPSLPAPIAAALGRLSLGTYERAISNARQSVPLRRDADHFQDR